MIFNKIKNFWKVASVGSALGLAAVTGNASEHVHSDYTLGPSHTISIPKKIFEVTAKSGVKARSGPSTTAKYLGFSLKKETDVFAIEYSEDSSGNMWIKVLSPTSNQTFWICATFGDAVLAKEVLQYDYSGDLITQAYRQYSDIFSKGYGIDKKYVGKMHYINDKLNEVVSYYNQNEVLKKAKRLDIAKELAIYVDLPVEVIVSIWYRENAKMPVDMYFHNGKELGKEMTLNGKSYFFKKSEFFKAAKDTLNSPYYNTLKNRLNLTYKSKDKAAIATFIESHRGFMHRKGGGLSPYIFSGTTFDNISGLQHNGKELFAKDSRPGYLLIAAMFRS